MLAKLSHHCGLGEDIRRKQMCWAPPVTDPRDGERQIEHCTSPSMEGTNRCLAKELCPSPQPFHPGLQPTRGAALVHGSSPLQQSSLEGLYSHIQKSSFTNFLSISWPHQANSPSFPSSWNFPLSLGPSSHGIRRVRKEMVAQEPVGEDIWVWGLR